MRKKCFLVFLFSLLLACFAHAGEFPKSHGFVNDFAKVMSSDAREKLESRIADYEKTTSVEIAVATIPDLGGRSISDYAINLFEQWGIGKKDLDNGVLLLVAPNEPKGATKAWIVTGRGIEEVITDLKSGRVVSEAMRPFWKKGRREEAIVAGVERIISDLGTMPFRQQLEAKKRLNELNAAARKREIRLMKKAFQGFVALVVFASCTGAAVWFFRNRAEKRRQSVFELEKFRSLAASGQADALARIADFREKRAEMEEVFTEKSIYLLPPESEEMRRAIAAMQETAKMVEHGLPSDEEIATGKIEALKKMILACDTTLDTIRQKMRWLNDSLQTLKKVERAANEVPNLLGKMSPLLEKTQAKIIRDDVKPATRERLRIVEQTLLARKIDKDWLVGKKTDAVDWFAAKEMLGGLIEKISSINCAADADVEGAKTARAKGPHLFERFPMIIMSGENKVSQYGNKVSGINERLKKAKTLHAQAKEIVAASATTDWPVVYPLLVAAEKENEGITDDIARYEDRQRKQARERALQGTRSSATKARGTSGTTSRQNRSNSDSGFPVVNVDYGGGGSVAADNFGGGTTGGGGGGGGLD